MKALKLAAGALALSLSAGAAQSAVLFAFEETGGNVVGTLSGSLDLTGASYLRTASVGSGIVSSRGEVAIEGNVYMYAATGPAPFGSAFTPTFGTGVGSPFFVQGVPGRIGVGVSTVYTSGSALSGTLTFLTASFLSLGITPGEYVYTLPNDTVTLRFSQAQVVPLPATLPLLLGGLGLAFAAARRRR